MAAKKRFLLLLPGLMLVSGANAADYGYTGREADASGLTYYRARYYDPTAARFTQRDPIGADGGNNDYAYVDGNPLNARDPYGHAASAVDPPGFMAKIASYFTGAGIMDPGVVSADYSRLPRQQQQYEESLAGRGALLGALLAGANFAPYLALAEESAAVATGLAAAQRLLPDKFRIYATSSPGGPIRDAGHQLAWQVLPGGSGRAIVGNQIVEEMVGLAQVPRGTALTMLAPGKVMTSDLALIMEADQLGYAQLTDSMMKTLEGALTHLPGAMYRDYLVGTAKNLFILRNSISRPYAANLSQMLRPNMGCVSVAISTLCQ